MIDSSKYCDYNKVVELKNIAYKELMSCDWRQLTEFLRSQPRDDDSNDGPSWMYQEGHTNEQVYSYEDSLSERQANTIDHPNAGDWLCLTFIDKCFQKQTPHDFVKQTFKQTQETVKTLQGINHFSIHFVSPKFNVVKHRDLAKNIYSLLVKLKSTSALDQSLDLRLTNYADYNLIGKDFFTFDPDIEHTACNNSDQDWIFLMLRIHKEYFNG